MSGRLILKSLEGEDFRWDAYVKGHPDGSVYHGLGFKRAIQAAYPHRAVYQYVERDGEIQGLLPAFISGSPWFSRALVSVPVGVEGGILASDPEAANRLREGAREIMEREGLAYVEYKSRRPLFQGLPTEDQRYFGFETVLLADPEAQMAKLSRDCRRLVRRAEAAGMEGDWNREDLAAFYDLYSLSLRNLGTPMFPKAFFEACLREMPETDLFSVRLHGRIVAVVMSFYFGTTMLPFFVGSLPEARALGVNNFVYAAMLKGGHARGYRRFDFGRSKAGTGALAFKRSFGMAPIPLAYQYELRPGSPLPSINPQNPKYQRAIALWKRLPVGLSQRLGPWFSRRLP